MAKSKPSEVKVGEQTGPQKVYIDHLYGYIGTLASELVSAPKPTLGTYRIMRKHPTIALGRAIANVPIRTAKWGVTNEEGTPERIVDFVRTEMERIWPGLIKDLLRGRDFGFQAFEKVWEVNRDLQWTYKKLKALTPEMTKAVVHRETGAFLGIKQDNMQGDKYLDAKYCLWYAHNPDPGDWYGNSDLENVREDGWHPWRETQKKLNAYNGKVAGVIPIIQYVPGQGTDKDGVKRDKSLLAFSLLEKLGKGSGIAIPMELVPFADDLLRSGADVKDLMAWQISFLEARGQHASGMISSLKYYDALMLRGLFVPERAAMEGQFGTKAEAETHGDLATTIASLVFEDMLDLINHYVVNPLITVNYGEQYVDQIKLESAGVDPNVLALYRELVKSVLGNAVNVDLFQTWLDYKAILDEVGLPVDEEAISEMEEEEGKQEGSPSIPGQTPEGKEEDGEGIPGQAEDGRPPGKMSATVLRNVYRGA